MVDVPKLSETHEQEPPLDRLDAGLVIAFGADALHATPARKPLEAANTVIGPYKLLEQIGEGGFGAVFMAEQQQPLRRRVALKIIKPGMDSKQVIARFEAERQALALMDHPNIAKVLDAGAIPGDPSCVSAGRPYFVMELVRGIPITDSCDHNRLSVRERLELFVTVCQAVQHAHQKGIIHRDLKPGNVLVTLHDGTPLVKVIDFGIAKALGEQRLTDKTLFTGFAQMIGTPLYMSPEQAEMSGQDADTRTDIYSLGVLLYELLTGTTPFDKERLEEASYDEIRRIIREEEPAKPSTRMSTLGPAAHTLSAYRKSEPRRLSQLFRGELDWIVMKALEKDRDRRYETASSFAADVLHYLQDEPVEACPPSATYRLRKFARRNQAGLAVAGVVVLCLVLIGGSGVWAMRERSERLAAAEQAVKRVVHEATTLQGQAKWPEALESARRAEGLLSSGGSDELRLRVGELRKDLEMVLRLEEIRLPDLVAGTEGSLDEVTTDARIARAFREYGIDVESLEPAEAGERVRARTIRYELVLALDHWVKVRTSLTKGSRTANDPLRKRLLSVARTADPDEWRKRLRNALEYGPSETLTKLAVSAPISNLPLQSLSLLGWALDFAGRGPQAVAVLQQAQRTYPDDFMINFQLAWALDHGSFPSPVERLRDEVIRFYTVARALRPRNVPVHAVLGRALCSRGKFDEAMDVYRKAIELNPNQAVLYYWFALAQLAAGDVPGYRSTCAAMLEHLGRAEKPAVAPWIAWVSVLAGDSLNDPGRPVKLVEAAIRSDPTVERHSIGLGAALYRAGRSDEAVQRLNRASATTKMTTYSPAYAWFFLAMAHHRLDHREEARVWLDKAIKWMEQETRNASLPWNRRFTLQLLRREAEPLVLGLQNRKTGLNPDGKNLAPAGMRRGTGEGICP